MLLHKDIERLSSETTTVNNYSSIEALLCFVFGSRRIFVVRRLQSGSFLLFVRSFSYVNALLEGVLADDVLSTGQDNQSRSTSFIFRCAYKTIKQ